jgi:hypothetical protein
MPGTINDSLRGREQNGEFTSKNIWAQLAKRSTTERKDLYGIVAVTRGSSAQWVSNSQGKQPRSAEGIMLAILKAQKSLPLSMFYLPPKDTIL